MSNLRIELFEAQAHACVCVRARPEMRERASGRERERERERPETSDLFIERFEAGAPDVLRLPRRSRGLIAVGTDYPKLN